MEKQFQMEIQESNNGAAAVLSFVFPGLGQIYQKRLGAGFLLFILFIVGIPLIFPAIVVWVVGILDAFMFKAKNKVVMVRAKAD